MARKSNRIRQLGRKQFDRRLSEAREVTTVFQPPTKGWVAAVRTALGMTQADLAERMGVSRQAVSHLEKRELEGSVTLNALREAAEALGSQVSYAVVPDRPISETLETRAYKIARRMVTSVRHSMRLEDQETDTDLEARIQEIANEVLAMPNRLWSHPDAE